MESAPHTNIRQLDSNQIVPQVDLRQQIKQHCEICAKDKVPSEMFLMNCSHIFCKGCFREYSLERIRAYKTVTCPHQNCKNVVEPSDYSLSELPYLEKKRYPKIYRLSIVEKDLNLRLCPKQSCEGILNIKTSPFACAQCKGRYCYKCMMDVHAGSCDNFQQTFLKERLLYKKCTKCLRFIERSDGCHHITCLCGNEFCFLCGEQWNSTHYCESPQSINQFPIFIPRRPPPRIMPRNINIRAVQQRIRQIADDGLPASLPPTSIANPLVRPTTGQVHPPTVNHPSPSFSTHQKSITSFNSPMNESIVQLPINSPAKKPSNQQRAQLSIYLIILIRILLFPIDLFILLVYTLGILVYYTTICIFIKSLQIFWQQYPLSYKLLLNLFLFFFCVGQAFSRVFKEDAIPKILGMQMKASAAVLECIMTRK